VNDFAGFFALAIVVIVTPGQDTALTIRNSLLGGRTGVSRRRSGSRSARPPGHSRRAPAWSPFSSQSSRPSPPCGSRVPRILYRDGVAIEERA
jgi:hypothetical protein